MLITSKFHDYYDTAMGQGIDKSCVYERLQKEHHVNIKPVGGNNWRFMHDSGLNFYREDRGEYYMYKRVLAFCGQMFPFIHVEKKFNHRPAEQLFSKRFYNANEFTKFMYEKGMLEKDSRNSWRDYIDTEKGIKKFFDVSKYDKYFQKYFLEYKTPIFLIKRSEERGMDFKIETNPNLRLLHFMGVKDPYTAYQEIYMYLAGVLGNKENDITEVDDEIKARQHGFDKHSFKTMKGDKKPRKKNRGKK